MMVGTLLSFIGLFYLPQRWYDRVYLLSEGAFGVFLVYWLNRKGVRDYFGDVRGDRTRETKPA